MATILVALRLEFSAFFPEDQVASISDHLLGFPGESEKEWQRSLDLVERIGFGHLHIFAYSTWPGTRASALPNPVPREIIRARSQALHTLGSRLKRQVLERFVGRTFPVLVEQRQEESRGEALWTGYTRPLHFTRDGFLVVVIFWGGISTVAALPFILAQMSLREVRRLIHSHALIPVRLGRRVLRERSLEAIWGFFAVYVITFVVLMLLMMHAGLDQVSAFSAITTSMNNLGPGLGKVSTTFTDVSDSAKLIAAFAMLLGRLEIFTILVLLMPEFWRR